MYSMGTPSVQHLWIPGQIPGLNELFEARTHGVSVGHAGRRWDAYSKLKREVQERVVYCARTQRLEPVSECFCTYLFYEPHRRRDPSNFIGGGIKLIEDGLRQAEILPSDGWQCIRGIATYWGVDAKAPGTAVFLSKHNVLDRATAVLSDSDQRK